MNQLLNVKSIKRAKRGLENQINNSDTLQYGYESDCTLHRNESFLGNWFLKNGLMEIRLFQRFSLFLYVGTISATCIYNK